MAGDRGHLDVEALLLEEHKGASDREAADVTAAKATANDDVLGLLPLVELEEARCDGRKFPGEVLHRRVHKPGCQGIVAFEILVELGFGQLPGRRVAERVLSVLSEALPPMIENVPEGALVRTVAEKSVLVLELFIVSIDHDARQHMPSVLYDGGKPDPFPFGHGLPRFTPTQTGVPPGRCDA